MIDSYFGSHIQKEDLKKFDLELTHYSFYGIGIRIETML